MELHSKVIPACALVALLMFAPTVIAADPPDPPPCPSEPSEERFIWALNPRTSMTHALIDAFEMKPCETVLVQLSASYRLGQPPERVGCGSGGLTGSVTMSLKIKNSSGIDLATENFECTGGSCFVELPKADAQGYPLTPAGYPLPGTRLAPGLAKYIEVYAGGFNWCAIPPVSYTLLVKKQPRPLYNLGGDSFANARLIEVGQMQYGSVHPFESPGSDPLAGQIYRIRLRQDQLIYVSGEATGHIQWKSNFVIQVFNQNQQFLTNLANILPGSAVQFPAETTDPATYVNTGPDADFFLRVRATGLYPTWDFKFQVESPRLTVSPNPVTRGESATFRVLGAHRATIDGWRFESPGHRPVVRQTNIGAVTWPGVMAVGGTGFVAVKMAGRAIPIPLSEAVSVVPRKGWAFEAKPPKKEPWLFRTPVGGSLLDPVNPPDGTYPVGGEYGLDIAWSGADTDPIADDGPNHQFKFVRTKMSDTIPKGPTQFYWVLAPDLDLDQVPPPGDPTKEFYRKQCGDYNPETQTGFFISGAALLANTIRHERGESASHYSQYVTAQNNPDNNLGVFAERAVAGPEISQQAFNESVAAGLVLRRNGILGTTRDPEPYAVNYDATGRKLGEINLPPYVDCPQQ